MDTPILSPPVCYPMWWSHQALECSCCGNTAASEQEVEFEELLGVAASEVLLAVVVAVAVIGLDPPHGAAEALVVAVKRCSMLGAHQEQSNC